MDVFIGIMSDSHGDVSRTTRAIELIKEYSPVHVFHCGDICGQPIITELEAGFAEPEIPVTCVLGNCDGWQGGISPALPHVSIQGRLAQIEVGKKQIGVTHGHEMNLLDEMCTCGKYDYVFTGHTHVQSDDRINGTRIINPGALHRAQEPSCAVLNLETDELTYLPVS